MKREFKCHPLMIFRFIVPVLFIPTVPVIKAALEYLIVGNTKNFVKFEVLALISVILIGFLGLKNYKIEINEKSITIKYGFIVRRKACFKRSAIATFKTSQNIIDTLFHCATCEISTEAGRLKRTEFVFKLYYKDADFLQKELYCEEKGEKIKFTLLKRIIMAASSSSFVTGLVISIPIMKRADALFGSDTQEKIADNISETAKSIKSFLPPIVNAAAISVVVFFAFSFVVFLFRYILFAVKDTKKAITVKNGFFVRKKTTFSKDKIIAVETRQTPLLRILRLCSVSASVGGSHREKGERGAVLPCISKEKAKAYANSLLLFKDNNENRIKPDKTKETKNRFLFKPLVFFGVLLATTFLLCSRFNSFHRFALSLLVVSGLFVLYYANLCESAFSGSYLGIGEETISAKGIEGLKLKEMNCRKKQIGEIKIIRLPPDIWHSTCKVRITAHSKQAPTVKAVHLDYQKTQEMISKV